MGNFINFLVIFAKISLVLGTPLPPEDPILIKMNNFSVPSINENLKNTEINLEQLLKNHPKVVFLGRHNNKSFFLERILATQLDAREIGCPSMGMALARLESQEEVNFIGSVAVADNNLWTDGRNVRNASGYVWDNSYTVPRDISVYWTSGVSIGLLFHNNAGNFQFRIAYSNEEFYYLCYLGA